jgi:hypothetical protein
MVSCMVLRRKRLVEGSAVPCMTSRYYRRRRLDVCLVVDGDYEIAFDKANNVKDHVPSDRRIHKAGSECGTASLRTEARKVFAEGSLGTQRCCSLVVENVVDTVSSRQPQRQQRVGMR